jgi:hypothetical protein
VSDACDRIETPEQARERKAQARATRAAELEAARLAQSDIDLDALDDAKAKYGDTNVTVLHVPHIEGFPTFVLGRVPSTVEIKRYRDTIKPNKDNSPGDPVRACEQLAAVCRIYPESADVYKEMLDARPAIHVQLGGQCALLAAGSAEAQSKS